MGINLAMGALTLVLCSLFLTITQANTLGTIGENDSVAVKADGSNIAPVFRPYLDAIGMLVIDQRASCTATHLGNGYVLSAGHCFYYGSATGTLINSGGVCEGVTVRWGFRGTTPSSTGSTGAAKNTSRCTELIFAESTRLRDFAIFKVDHAPLISIPFSMDHHRPPFGTQVSLFGHPKQKPLFWSNYCTLKQAPPHRGAESGQFLHECDTDQGDSGAAILAVNGSGEVRIVGVHTGEYMPQKSLKPQPARFNSATFFFDVRKELAERDFHLEKRVNP